MNQEDLNISGRKDSKGGGAELFREQDTFRQLEMVELEG